MEGRVRPQGVVLPAPAIRQSMSLGHCGEQLGVQKLIPERTIKKSYKPHSYKVIRA
jgi:hypothetical protein